MSRFRKLPPPVEGAHPLYPASVTEAVATQKELRERIDLTNRFGPLRTIAGVDVGYDIGLNHSRAAVALMAFPSLELLDVRIASVPTGFAYVPGLLSFREIPAIVEALAQLPEQPDLLMVDGHGVAHPRRLGIAAHLGLLTDLPTIGVAKSRLVGTHDEPGPARGDSEPLFHKTDLIGVVLRSRERVRPLFVSPGHRVDFDTAVAITLGCLTRYRLPEPTRHADKYSKIGAKLPLIGQPKAGAGPIVEPSH